MQIKKRKICSFTNIFVILQPIMKSFMSQIWHSASARNVGKLLSANIIAQAIGLLVYPILTRLYSPEDFGLLNLFCSIGGVLILLAPLEWYNAIVLPERDEDARPVVHISLLAIAAMTVLLVFSLPFAEPIAALFKSPDLAVYWWLLPIYVLLMSVWNVLNHWYIRRKAYGRISGYQVSQSLFSAGYKTGFGWLGFLNGGLIWSSILSPLCPRKNTLSPCFISIGRNAVRRLPNMPISLNTPLPEHCLTTLSDSCPFWYSRRCLAHG